MTAALEHDEWADENLPVLRAVRQIEAELAAGERLSAHQDHDDRRYRLGPVYPTRLPTR